MPGEDPLFPHVLRRCRFVLVSAVPWALFSLLLSAKSGSPLAVWACLLLGPLVALSDTTSPNVLWLLVAIFNLVAIFAYPLWPRAGTAGLTCLGVQTWPLWGFLIASKSA